MHSSNICTMFQQTLNRDMGTVSESFLFTDLMILCQLVGVNLEEIEEG